MMAVTAGTATAATAAATRGTGGTGVAGTGAGTGATGGVADHSRDAMGCKGMQDILDAPLMLSVLAIKVAALAEDRLRCKKLSDIQRSPPRAKRPLKTNFSSTPLAPTGPSLPQDLIKDLKADESSPTLAHGPQGAGAGIGSAPIATPATPAAASPTGPVVPVRPAGPLNLAEAAAKAAAALMAKEAPVSPGASPGVSLGSNPVVPRPFALQELKVSFEVGSDVQVLSQGQWKIGTVLAETASGFLVLTDAEQLEVSAASVRRPMKALQPGSGTGPLGLARGPLNTFTRSVGPRPSVSAIRPSFDMAQTIRPKAPLRLAPRLS
ncbi:unnamed protein product [Symbiodinium natans]|uniref:Uncharacterized protein n=1 Tax=Symbiodinium natans TaxID=878477 RepID=A0A812TL90_9DINO|nr:unnamed protein product [Symbiodinium natans]